MATEILMPSLAPTMTEGNIAKWHIRVGDRVQIGDVICEIESEKAVVELQSEVAGIVEKLLVPEGAEGVPVNTAIALISGPN